MQDRTEGNKRSLPHKKKGIKKFSAFLPYISLSSEMTVTMLACAWLGRYLDEKTGMEKPYFTLGLLLFGLFSSIVLLIKGLGKISKNNQDKKHSNKDEGV